MAKTSNERRSIARGRLSILRDSLYSTLRWIARHVRGFFGALAAFLTVSLVVGFTATAVFTVFASFVMRGFTQRLDDSVLRWVELHRAPLLNEIMFEITALGGGFVLALVVLVASVFLWLTHHRWSVCILILGVAGGQLINDLLKGYFERPRPSVVEWMTEVSTKSFPSGHAMTAMITYGAVAYLVARLEPTRTLRNTIWALAAVIILAIGMSRVYLGVHYPSDVIAGYLGGIAWLSVVASSLTAVRFFAPRRPATQREEHDLSGPAADSASSAA